MSGHRLELKRLAGRRAAELVEPGMVVGLGSGSTAAEFVRALAARVADGLQIRAVASSLGTASLARSLGIEIGDLNGPLDLAADGADAVERGSLAAIKGLGGALVREKLVARAAERFVLVVDETKLYDRLAESQPRIPLPIEVLPFGWEMTQRQLSRFGDPRLRRINDEPFLSDNGNLILDLHGADLQTPQELGAELKTLTGVVDHGLFCGLATQAIVATASGIEELRTDR